MVLCIVVVGFRVRPLGCTYITTRMVETIEVMVMICNSDTLKEYCKVKSKLLSRSYE